MDDEERLVREEAEKHHQNGAQVYPGAGDEERKRDCATSDNVLWEAEIETACRRRKEDVRSKDSKPTRIWTILSNRVIFHREYL